MNRLFDPLIKLNRVQIDIRYTASK